MKHMKGMTVEEFDRIQHVTAKFQQQMVNDFGPNPDKWPTKPGGDNYVVRQILAILEEEDDALNCS